jgi:dipeptidyl aminopeptidase/acylaminoacyl peptidase
LIVACDDAPSSDQAAEEPVSAAVPVAEPGVPPPAPTSADGIDDPDEDTWLQPPEDVVRIVDTPPTPWVLVSPDAKTLALASAPGLPSLERVAEPFLRLAGVRVDPVRHQRHRTYDTTSIRLRDVDGAGERPVEVPPEARLSSMRFSPDGAHLAFVHDTKHEAQVWVADVSTGKSRVVARAVNGVLGTPYTWLPDSSGLVVRAIPTTLGPAPVESLRPSGPSVQTTSGRKAMNRTYQDLLSSRHDERAFTHYASFEPTLVPLDGPRRVLGEAGVYQWMRVSPDGTRMVLQRLVEPYSRVVPYYRFARQVEIWDLGGGETNTIASLPAADEVPIGGVPEGPRNIDWDPWEDATLTWAEALDGGDPKREADRRDKWVRASGSDFSTRTELARTEHRARGIEWLQTRGEYLLTEYDRDRRWIRTHRRKLDDSSFSSTLVDRSIHDRYGDPGDPLTVLNDRGFEVVRVQDGAIFRRGSGATPEGDRPFVDRVPLDGSEKTRLFHAPEDGYARAAELREDGSLIIRTESPSQPPNYVLRPAGAGDATKDVALTAFPHPHPQLSAIEGELIKYAREDGVPLSGTLYLPPGHKDGDRHPLVIWAYPVEYLDKDTAGQVRAAPTRFRRLAGTSPLFFLTQGYAVLDGAAMPVVGDPETMNETLIEQLVGAAGAAIDAVDARGVVDRDRVAIAGHSYGAFMTANLLAHSDLFRTGIARSGAYNRTLTPFGFQSERRTLWDATETYVRVSPLFAADQIDEPLLMFHGEVDSNSGTFPIQSERLFHAMSGLGGTAKLVMLPHESHGYRARESTLHVLGESFAWLDEHMKPRTPSG